MTHKQSRIHRLHEYHANNPDARRQNRLKRFGLTPEQYDRMHELQDGACAICKKPESVVDRRSGLIRSLAVDHDHSCCPDKYRSCGQCIRGLLCQRCNNGLGQFQDDPTTLTAALAYLMGGTPYFKRQDATMTHNQQEETK